MRSGGYDDRLLMNRCFDEYIESICMEEKGVLKVMQHNGKANSIHGNSFRIVMDVSNIY